MYLTQIFMDVCTSLCLNGDTRPKLNNYNKIKIWSNFKNFGLPALEVKLLWEITWDSSVVLLVIFRRLWPRKLEILLFVFPFLLDLYEQKRTYFWITCFYVCKVIGCLRALCDSTTFSFNYSHGIGTGSLLGARGTELRIMTFEQDWEAEIIDRK